MQHMTALAPLLFFPTVKSTPVQDHLPTILILGDSISIGYTPFVIEKLQGKAEVRRPNENCHGSTRRVEKIDEWPCPPLFKAGTKGPQ